MPFNYWRLSKLYKGQHIERTIPSYLREFQARKLLKGTLKDIISSPYLIDNILGTTIGLATGYLSKKIVIGASGNIFRKLFGSAMQFGVTNVVAQHPDTIKSLGQAILHFHKKNGVDSHKA